VGYDAIAVIGRNRLPQIKFRLHGHNPIVARACAARLPTTRKPQLMAAA
jgi:hypothetical protein